MKFKPSVSNEQGLFSAQHVTDSIVLPDDLSLCPTVILLLSPGRSGSTAFLFAFSRLMPAYFQPMKNILQFGEPPLRLPPVPFVFMKEVFGFWHEPECRMDAVGILLNAGLPPSKLRVICVLRDPLRTYDSWLEHFEEVSLDRFISSYVNVLDQERIARDAGIATMAVAYESLAEGSGKKFGGILEGLAVPHGGPVIDWNADDPVVESRIVLPPEADDPLFRELFLNKVRERREFHVETRDLEWLGSDDARVLKNTLSPVYRQFVHRAMFGPNSIS